MRTLVLLRPEPGLSASAARARALGLDVIEHALFTVEPVPATLPDGEFDAMVVTSANAVRCGGALLDRFHSLPAYAVGQATAAALREAGIEPSAVGTGGVEGLALPPGRLLHLCGETHKPLIGKVAAVPVYRMAPTDEPLPDLGGKVVAVHSPAAGARLDALAGRDRGRALVAAISPAAALSCGAGWAAIQSAAAPDDESLLALAAVLCQSLSQ